MPAHKPQPARKPAPTLEPSAPGRRFTSPRFTLPALGLVSVVAAVFGVLLALGVTGDSPQALNVTTCTVSTPGCELRAPTHIHANFSLVIRGQRFDFNQPQFLSVEGNDRSAVAHLHAPRFGVVHVHRTGTSWGEFLESIGFALNDPSIPGTTVAATCLKLPDGQKLCATGGETFKFFANGIRVDGIAFNDISDLDRVLLSFGADSDATVAQQIAQLGDDACIPSERCTDRIPKGEPPEPCTKSNDTCVKTGG